jgi:bacterioferritin-associated ferredoxin
LGRQRSDAQAPEKSEELAKVENDVESRYQLGHLPRVIVLVCHCRAVCDRQIRQCVRAGTTSLEGIGDRTGAGTGCGGCHDTILDIVDGETQPEISAAMPATAPGSPGLRRLPMVHPADLSEVA